MGKPLFDRIIEAGYSTEDIFNHESDLYVYVNDMTTKVIKDWCEENNFNMEHHAPKFKDNITGRMMYDCIFQYSPWWDAILEK